MVSSYGKLGGLTGGTAAGFKSTTTKTTTHPSLATLTLRHLKCNTPTMAPPRTSLLLTEAASARSQARCVRCLGWSCVPCCCVGCLCLMQVGEVDAQLRRADAIVAFYGGAEGCKAAADGVRREQGLFIDAVNRVRALGGPVYPGVTLLDCLAYADASGNLARALPNRVWLTRSSGARDQYLAAVHAEYVALGGDGRRVIFGLPEYLLHAAGAAFTSISFASACDAFVDPTHPLSGLARDNRVELSRVESS